MFYYTSKMFLSVVRWYLHRVIASATRREEKLDTVIHKLMAESDKSEQVVLRFTRIQRAVHSKAQINPLDTSDDVASNLNNDQSPPQEVPF